MKIIILCGLVLACARCDNGNDMNGSADGTRVDQRHPTTTAPTLTDQGENEVDSAITRKVRQGVMKDNSLSIAAKDVKIVTTRSIVTLRGLVKNDKERSDVGTIAAGTEGVERVDNHLEIEASGTSFRKTIISISKALGGFIAR